jgi:hypothetical protein
MLQGLRSAVDSLRVRAARAIHTAAEISIPMRSTTASLFACKHLTTHSLMISRVLTNLGKRVAWSNSSATQSVEYFTEIYSYNYDEIRDNEILRPEMRSRLASSTSSDLQPQWASISMHKRCCGMLAGHTAAARSAQRLNSADTAGCCRAPNSLRASSLRP